MAYPISRPTMRDVAERAGVSPKTVSNVVTGTVPVSEKTRTRVEAAMVELDFVPNLSARGLRNGRTGIIGFALPDLTTAFSASIAHSVVEAAHARGLVVQIEETAFEPTREYDLVYRARTHQIDGLILNPVRLEDSVVDHVQHLPPVVLIGEVEQHSTDRVFIDSRQAGRTAAQHLMEQGARRIAVLGGTTTDMFAKQATLGQRLQGVLDAFSAAQVKAAPELQVDVRWSIAGGADAMREILAREVEFDAVFAFTDSIAVGALHVLHDYGLRVPEDVLVMGFDNVEHAAYTWPPLTTISFDHKDYVTAALDLLASRVADRNAPTRAVEVAHTLIPRRSTQGPPRGHTPPASP